MTTIHYIAERKIGSRECLARIAALLGSVGHAPVPFLHRGFPSMVSLHRHFDGVGLTLVDCALLLGEDDALIRA